jgi:hypothetical protein
MLCTLPFLTSLVDRSSMALLQGGVGLHIAALVHTQTGILRLYPPIPPSDAGSLGETADTRSSGGRRASLHGGGSGAISQDDGTAAPAEQSAPTAAATATDVTAEGHTLTPAPSAESGASSPPPDAGVPSPSGSAHAVSSSRPRATRRLSEVRTNQRVRLHPTRLHATAACLCCSVDASLSGRCTAAGLCTLTPLHS